MVTIQRKIRLRIGVLSSVSNLQLLACLNCVSAPSCLRCLLQSFVVSFARVWLGGVKPKTRPCSGDVLLKSLWFEGIRRRCECGRLEPTTTLLFDSQIFANRTRSLISVWTSLAVGEHAPACLHGLRSVRCMKARGSHKNHDRKSQGEAILLLSTFGSWRTDILDNYVEASYCPTTVKQ